MIWPISEARAEIQKSFRSFFGSNEDIQKSFWNYLTFSNTLIKYFATLELHFWRTRNKMIFPNVQHVLHFVFKEENIIQILGQKVFEDIIINFLQSQFM